MLNREVKMFDASKYTDEEIEMMAIKEQKKMQDFHDKLENGQLSDEEQKAVDNTEKFENMIASVGGIRNMTSEKFREFRETIKK